MERIEEVNVLMTVYDSSQDSHSIIHIPPEWYCMRQAAPVYIAHDALNGRIYCWIVSHMHRKQGEPGVPPPPIGSSSIVELHLCSLHWPSV